MSKQSKIPIQRGRAVKRTRVMADSSRYGPAKRSNLSKVRSFIAANYSSPSSMPIYTGPPVTHFVRSFGSETSSATDISIRDLSARSSLSSMHAEYASDDQGYSEQDLNPCISMQDLSRRFSSQDIINPINPNYPIQGFNPDYSLPLTINFQSGSYEPTPPFGLQQKTFGFGGAAATAPFGQPSTFMNNSPSTGFNQNVGGFGSTTPMFGGISNPPSSAPLFGSTNTSSFGTGQAGFGTSLFGNNQQQPSTSGIFGGASTTFGQQNKTAGFGFGQSSQTPGLFGQNQTNQNASLFQPSTSANVFGSPSAFGGNAQTGTIYKFVPVTGTDSMQKSGIAQTISTKHHCITCMKEYESKSLEELRWEDYQANRRGPQPTGFGSQPFGASAVSTTPSLFGQTENKTVFGQSSFGQAPFGMTNQPTTNQSIFGRSGFGTPTTTTASTFGFGTNTGTSSLFGTNQQTKFGQATPVFGQPQTTNTAFGAGSNIFGQNNTQNKGSIFAAPSQPTAFGQQQNTYAFGQPVATQSNTIFGQAKATTGMGGFFGGTNTNAPTFGQPFGFGGFGTNTFSKPSQTAPFGQPTQSGAFGSNLGLQSGGLFGNAPKQANLFTGANQTGNLFNNSAFQQPNAFALPTQQQTQPVMQNVPPPTTELSSVLCMTDPYGFQNCLGGLDPMKQSEIKYSTNPKELQKILDAPKYIPPVLSPISERNKNYSAPTDKINLFDEKENEKENKLQQSYTFRNTPKRLVLHLKKGKNDGPKEHLSLGDDDQSTSEGSNKTDLEISKSSSSSDNAVDVSIRNKNPSGTYTFKPVEQPSTSTEDKDDSSNENTSFALSKDFSGIMAMTKYNTNVEVEDKESPTTDTPKSKDTAAKEPGTDSSELSEPASTETTNNTCGVTFKRSDYFMVPPPEDLPQFVNSEGRCIVTGLVIGRIGYGNVYFSTPVDLTNLNIDELVHFRYRELTIYPDDTVKPPVGQGLNHPAQVTLDQVWPKNRKSHNVVSDIDYLIAMKFNETLKDLCLKHGTKFIDYRPDTGSWVFFVEHFSKYGFTDSDEEEAADRLEKYEEKALEKKHIEDQRIKETKNADITESARNVGLGGVQSTTPMRRSASTSSLNIGTSMDVYSFQSSSVLKPSRMHQPHAIRTLFEEDTLSEMSSTDVRLMEEQLEFYPHNKEVVQNQITRSKETKNKVHTRNLKNWCGRVPLIYSLLNSRNYYDIAVFKGRSFKIGWSKGFTYTSSLLTDSPTHASYDVHFDEIEKAKISHRHIQLKRINYIHGDLNNAFEQSLEKHLEIIYNNSHIMKGNSLPLYKSYDGNEILSDNQDLAYTVTEAYTYEDSTLYVKDIWNLCKAFWGKLEDNTITRRELFSRWLEDISAVDLHVHLRECNEFTTENVLKKIYLYLTCHQIEEAARVARRNCFAHLSLLISQISSNGIPKYILNYQINQWDLSGQIDEIEADVIKMYLLLAGRPINRNVNICEGLKWRKAIALHLWYLTLSHQSLNDAVSMYEHSFKNDLSYSTCPNPPYIAFDDIWPYFDIQFHLMKLYANKNNPLEEMLNPFTHTSDPTDYRLSWLLLQILSAFGIGRISENAENHMHTNFAFQLENMGLYKWAVFVLMFIKDVNVKENLITAVLERNLSPDINNSNDVEHELVKYFNLPPIIVHNVKANKSQSVDDVWSTYKHLIYTKSWHNCHDLIMKKLIPSLLTNEYYDLMEIVLLNLYDGIEKILDWSGKGSIFLDFTEIRKKLIVKKDYKTKEAATELYSLTCNVCARLTHFRPKTSTEIVCVSEITKHIMSYMKSIQEILNFSFDRILVNYDSKIDDLTMPPDYRIDDLLDTINRFYLKKKIVK